MKHLVFAALGFAFAGGTMAQTVSTGAFSFPTVNEGSCMSVPKIFTYNNKPLLTLRDGQDGNGGVSAGQSENSVASNKPMHTVLLI